MNRRDLLAASAVVALGLQSTFDIDAMKTHWGINSSYANWTSRLPLFANPMRRGKVFEVFSESGTPSGDPSPLDANGWPVQDGRWHGVRLFGDQGGHMPEIAPIQAGLNVRQRVNPGVSSWVWWRGGVPDSIPRLSPSIGQWHLPSLEALNYFRPKTLRTLDYGYQARATKRPDWTEPRIQRCMLQGEEMAVELQCDLANKLNCHLWWNAPPRFELSVADYEVRLEEYLVAIRDTAERPVVLEYGNELWNDGFPVKRWLENLAGNPQRWHDAAANEIATLKHVADRVLGEGGVLGQRPYWLFVGGHIGTPDTLRKILPALGLLNITPDMAGPALYLQPRKIDEQRWESTGVPPSQAELKDSVLETLHAQRVLLEAHKTILTTFEVPYFGMYEVGQDMHANGIPYKTVALQAQREQWMGDAYTAARQVIEGAGVNLAMWYSCATAQSLDRSFGLLETTLDRALPLPKAIAARG